MGKVIDLTGKRFGWLTVIRRADNIGKRTAWLCKCDCGNEIISTGTHLKDGHTQSCGCYSKYINSKLKKQYNKYDLTSCEYGIGYTSGDDIFIFDKEDYNLICNFCWYKSNTGYLMANMGGKHVLMHRVILGLTQDDQRIDHKDCDRTNNRKCNLRIANAFDNAVNRSTLKNNTSRITGVSFMKKADKYEAYIGIDNNKKYLGIFSDFTDAALARLEAEEEYFCDFMPLNNRKILAYIRNGGRLEYGNKELINKIVNDVI